MTKDMYHIIIVGGGPAGVFAAIQAKNMNPSLDILILEKTSDILNKVKISGGGRCNVTNATNDIKALSLNYPRGNKELISAFHRFNPKDMINWLESKGVNLKIDGNSKVFPASDSSQTIVECFKNELKRLNIEILYNQDIFEICKNNENDVFEILTNDNITYKAKKLILATGGSNDGILYAKSLGHGISEFIPSLFSFKIAKNDITKLSGLSAQDVKVSLKGSSYNQIGDLLITHEGFSGPCIINLSSFAAICLFKHDYKAKLCINWLHKMSIEQIINKLMSFKGEPLFSTKTLLTLNPFKMKNRLWNYLLNNLQIDSKKSIKNISKKSLVKLAEKLFCDEYFIVSKSQNKGEFVSCGGVNRKEINFKDMQSKICSNLYLVGEMINIDGITGGYNLQNAWTTGYIAGISASIKGNN